ncbi:MAG: energy-coupling factor transport system permease protein [Mycobacterium sp.]|jgi:energy-coupling factor transporter transmembrane protein EcfT|nr:energy-coupling factor transport system permease protein [Mycobacterium sp.]
MTSADVRQTRPLVLLRPVPGPSVIHDLWAGTKLITALAISVLLATYPGWGPIALTAALLIITARLAHIPRGVLPSVPRWMWLVTVLAAATSVLAGGSPYVGVGAVTVGLGGLLDVARFAALTGVLVGVGALVSWTTNVADVAPAVAVLGRPLRWVRIPVDEWAVGIALAMRAFPMLLEEFRILYAARRLRPKPSLPATWRGRLRHWAGSVIDVLTAAITVALRRADEMGDAITARGGTGQISATPSRPKPRDWVALSVVTLVCGAALTCELMFFPTTMH